MSELHKNCDYYEKRENSRGLPENRSVCARSLHAKIVQT